VWWEVTTLLNITYICLSAAGQSSTNAICIYYDNIFIIIYINRYYTSFKSWWGMTEGQFFMSSHSNSSPLRKKIENVTFSQISNLSFYLLCWIRFSKNKTFSYNLNKVPIHHTLYSIHYNTDKNSNYFN